MYVCMYDLYVSYIVIYIYNHLFCIYSHFMIKNHFYISASSILIVKCCKKLARVIMETENLHDLLSICWRPELREKALFLARVLGGSPLVISHSKC